LSSRFPTAVLRIIKGDEYPVSHKPPPRVPKQVAEDQVLHLPLTVPTGTVKQG
jgi:hypothetical protein